MLVAGPKKTAIDKVLQSDPAAFQTDGAKIYFINASAQDSSPDLSVRILYTDHHH